MRSDATADDGRGTLDQHKTASFGPAGPSTLPFWPSTSRLRLNFVAAEPPERRIATNNFGIREMSVYMPRLEKFLRRRNKPRLQESGKWGSTLTRLAVRWYYRAEMRSPVPSGLWRSKGCEDDPKIVAVRLEREERHAYLDAKISLVVLCCVFHTSKHSICGER